MQFLLRISTGIVHGGLRRGRVVLQNKIYSFRCIDKTPACMVSGTTEVLERIACKYNDMHDGEMKEVDFGDDKKALLVKENGQYSAIGALCTHHKAPLSKGVLYKGRVRCPWHGACFNAKTGDIEDYPGLDSLHVYEVEIRGEDVVVKACADELVNFKRQKEMACRNNKEKARIVIVGSGAASLTCAESLRQQSYTGEITVVTKDNILPYDRTKLSKNFAVDLKSIALRDHSFYNKYNISMRLDTLAKKIDTVSKRVVLYNNESLPYDKLLLACGAEPRLLQIPGSKLKNIFTLRSAADAAAIMKEAIGKNAVVIGASFIGMEAASSLIGKAASVTVCEYLAAPYQSVLGEEVGRVFQGMHEERGVNFKTNAVVTEFQGSDETVGKVVLRDGTHLDADVVILGVGVQPSTEFLADSDVELDNRGFVKVNKYMETSVKDVYAAGDIALYPLKMRNWDHVNIQHWSMAHYHGNLIGRNMMKCNSDEAACVPFFWSNLGPGKNVRYTGHGAGYDDVIFTGNLADRKFCAYYCKGEEVVAMATFMMDPVASLIAEKWHNGETILKKDIF